MAKFNVGDIIRGCREKGCDDVYSVTTSLAIMIVEASLEDYNEYGKDIKVQVIDHKREQLQSEIGFSYWVDSIYFECAEEYHTTDIDEMLDEFY